MAFTTKQKQEYVSPKRPVVSKGIDALFINIALAFRFSVRYFKEVFRPPYEFEEITWQCYQIGVKSLPLIPFTGFVMG